MMIIAWALLGSIVGWIAARTISETGQRPAVDILLGILGSVASGYLFLRVGSDLAGPSYISMLEALLGAVAIVFARHVIIDEMASGPDLGTAPGPASVAGTGTGRGETRPTDSRTGAPRLPG